MTYYYFDKQTWELKNDPPGVRVSAPVAVVLCPLMGAMFAFFLPALGFVMVGWWIARRVVSLCRKKGI